MNELLHNLPVAETAAGSSVICKTLGQLPDYHKARRIMAFLSMPGEVDLDAFIEKALSDDKEVYVPRCLDKGHMEGVRLYDLGQTVLIATASERHPREHRPVLPTYRTYLSYPVLPLIKMAVAWGRGAGVLRPIYCRCPGVSGSGRSLCRTNSGIRSDGTHDRTVYRIVTEKEIIHVS